jgi:peptidoglycan/LPS O-acetylase OafA/YrhL
MEVIMKKLILSSILLLIISSQFSFAVNTYGYDDYAYEAPAVLHRVVNPRAYTSRPIISKDAPKHKQKTLVMRAANALCLGSLALLAVELPSMVENYPRKTVENIVMCSLSFVFLMYATAKKLSERL